MGEAWRAHAKAREGGIFPGEIHVGMFLQTLGHVSRPEHSAVFTAECWYAGPAIAVRGMPAATVTT